MPAPSVPVDFAALLAAVRAVDAATVAGGPDELAGALAAALGMPVPAVPDPCDVAHASFVARVGDAQVPEREVWRAAWRAAQASESDDAERETPSAPTSEAIEHLRAAAKAALQSGERPNVDYDMLIAVLAELAAKDARGFVFRDAA
jgi:hypothetical protein